MGEDWIARWLYADLPGEQPEVLTGQVIYRVKRRLRRFGVFIILFSSTLLYILWALWSSFDPWVQYGSLIMHPAFIAYGIYLQIGKIILDTVGIRKADLGYTREIRWPEVSEVERSFASGKVTMRAGRKKMVIGRHFVGAAHLLSEITARTGLQPRVRA